MMQSVDKNKVEKLSIWCNQKHSLAIVLLDKPGTKAICIADSNNAYIVSKRQMDSSLSAGRYHRC